MGNWRRVMIEGSCEADEVASLRELIVVDLHDMDPEQPFLCLSACGGLMGLPAWPAKEILAVGNMAERDYGPEDVAAALERCAEEAPSLEAVVHVGGDYESDECVATVRLEAGEATVGDPEREHLPEASQEQVAGNLLRSLRRR